MMPVHLLHRGHLNADALWFDANFLGEAEAQRRLLEVWRPGCRVQRLRGGYLLQFVSSSALPPTSLENTRRMAAVQAPGLLLLAGKEGYAALEVPKNAPSGPLIWARGGELVAETPAETVDPGSWLELGPIHRGQSLGLPPPPPALLVPVVTVDLRAKAGVTLDPRTAELLAALAEKRSLHVEPPANWARGPIGALLRSLFPPTPAPGQRLLAGPAPATPPPEPSFLHKQWVEFLLRSGLYGFIQNRQEEYLQELFSAFEDGNLNDALRRAIPMADPQEAGGAAMPAVGTPQPREQLRMTPGGQGSSAMHLEDQARETLRAHYRRAAQRLLDEGRVDEAVFVLSELLRDHAAAVTTLERAQRWVDAAKLAELRGMDPSLRVRLWLEAGEEATAIHIARQSGVLSPVVTSLEKQHPLLGHRLRRL
ncbi:MAG TPA: bpX6 domain-containing protein, partial [Myxococcota bacterium]|nr:bpX6 domain-containing protein [Myxococcota bacterium]